MRWALKSTTIQNSGPSPCDRPESLPHSSAVARPRKAGTMDGSECGNQAAMDPGTGFVGRPARRLGYESVDR